MSELIQEKSHIGVQKTIVPNPSKLQEIYKNISELIQVLVWRNTLSRPGVLHLQGGSWGSGFWKRFRESVSRASLKLMKLHVVCHLCRSVFSRMRACNIVRFSVGSVFQKMSSGLRPPTLSVFRNYLSNRLMYLGLYVCLVAQLRPEPKALNFFSV